MYTMLLHSAMARPICTKDSLKRVIPRKNVLFSGVDDVPLNFGSQVSKNKILGPLIGLSSVNDNTTQILITWTPLSEIFTGDRHHEWAFVGGPTTSSNNSKMADGGHIEFHKTLISVLNEHRLCTHIFVQRCNTEQTAFSLQCTVVESVATTTTSSYVLRRFWSGW